MPNEFSELRLSDYRAPEFLIDNVDLRFELNEDKTTVIAKLSVQANPECNDAAHDLILSGEELELISINLDNRQLSADRYELKEKTLIIKNVPKQFILSIKNTINPKANSELSGLYMTKGSFMTQCEAEGFRRITYFLDRPDVMATYTTTVIADKAKYPVLIVNGDNAGYGELPDGKHWVKWVDPYKKPSYLFALVAGNLELTCDEFITLSGRKIALQMYASQGLSDRCIHALKCLKEAMLWDEINYGRECDLNTYKIVAADDFNAGAMENKGLNIFNSLCVLASPATSTDDLYSRIKSVVGHEYFHNWSGNRVTLRNWFQLSLKEGLTTFRQNSFMEEQYSLISRIDDVRILWTRQFAEDAGPRAHAVLPQVVSDFDNFYTTTIYQKGAEIYRMLQVYLGKEKFRQGLDLYFSRHDGQAVTVEHFIKALEDAVEKDLSHFYLWFLQAGTPVVTVTDRYDDKQKTYTLKFTQSCPATPNQADKKPLPIPIKLALINSAGDASNEQVFLLNHNNDEITFSEVPSRPVPSLLRGFSAPVKLSYAYSKADLKLLAQHDNDLFNRWNASRTLLMQNLVFLIKKYQGENQLGSAPDLKDLFLNVLEDKPDDLEMLSLLISLPSCAEIAEEMASIDVDSITSVMKHVTKQLETGLHEKWVETYNLYNEQNYDAPVNQASAAKRSVKNTALYYLAKSEDANITAIIAKQFKAALKVNLTDTLAALNILCNRPSKEKIEALDQFYQQWQHDPNVILFWFEAQANSQLPDTLNEIKRLVQHEQFDFNKPNLINSLLRKFANNMAVFHDKSGEGYLFLTDMILKLDPINRSSAADLTEPLMNWKRYDGKRQQLMLQQLNRIATQPNISDKVKELVYIALKDAPVAQMKLDQTVVGSPSVVSHSVFKKQNQVVVDTASQKEQTNCCVIL